MERETGIVNKSDRQTGADTERETYLGRNAYDCSVEQHEQVFSSLSIGRLFGCNPHKKYDHYSIHVPGLANGIG